MAVSGGEPVYTVAGPPTATPAGPTVSDGDVLLVATLSQEAHSLAAEETIRDLRAAFAADLGEGTALVGGSTAIDVDTNDTSIRDRTVIIPVILVVILLILMLLLRAIVAPVLLILSVIVSFGAALGVNALVFNHVFDFPGADPAVPLYGFVFLVALGVDYNIFLMSRPRRSRRRRHAPRRPARPRRHRWGDHLGGPCAGGDVRGARRDPDPLPGPVGVHRGLRGASGHVRGAVAAGSRRRVRLGRVIWWPSKLWRRDGQRGGGENSTRTVPEGATRRSLRAQAAESVELSSTPAITSGA